MIEELWNEHIYYYAMLERNGERRSGSCSEDPRPDTLDQALCRTHFTAYESLQVKLYTYCNTVTTKIGSTFFVGFRIWVRHSP